MKSDKEDNRFILTMVVANHGDGSKVLSEAKNGVSGGTIFWKRNGS